MPELRAPEKRRIGIEIKPKVRYPDQTEAAIVHSTNVSLDRARAIWVVSLAHVRHFSAPDFVQLSKLEAGYIGVSAKGQQPIVFTPLVRAVQSHIARSNPD